MRRIVILAPLLPEARAVARALSLNAGFKGRVESSARCAVVLVGPKAVHLEATQELMPAPIILAGLGGGLAEGIGVGDLVLDRPLSLTGLGMPVHCGRIWNSPGIVTNSRDKMALHRDTGALAVDMEYEVARAFAAARGAPFLAIRAISDTVSDQLDPALLGLIDPEGRPRPSRALGMLLKNPSKLGSLLHIAKASKLALSHLAAGVAAVIRSGWPDGDGR